jgi:hypothetical protein
MVFDKSIEYLVKRYQRGNQNRISKKNRQHNGQKKKYKRTNNDLLNIHIKLRSSNTNLTKNGGELRCSGRVSSSWSTNFDYPFGIFWPLCCLFFFDIQILITPLVSFGHCVVCSSSIYRFWLPLWYLLVIFRRRTDNTMVKRKRTKGQTTIY